MVAVGRRVGHSRPFDAVGVPDSATRALTSHFDSPPVPTIIDSRWRVNASAPLL